jgi:hypothetical protein
MIRTRASTSACCSTWTGPRPSSLVRREAVYQVAALGTAISDPILKKALRDREPCRSPAGDSATPLRGSITPPNPRMSATLTQKGFALDTAGIARALAAETDATVLLAALTAVSAQHCTALLPRVEVLLRASAPVALEAAATLAELGAAAQRTRALAVLRTMLGDASWPEVQVTAAAYLARASDAAAVPVLRAALRSPSEAMRLQATVSISIGIPLLAAAGVGVLFIAIGVVGLAGYASRPSDAQIDAWLDQDVEALKSKALAKTGIDASELVKDQDSLIGFPLKNIAGAQRLKKRGKDNVLRTTPITITILNYTANQLIVYQCVFDRTTGKALNESADEYFYRHVVGVRTRTMCQTYQTTNGEIVQLELAEMFQLTTAGGTSVEVLLSDPKLIEMMGGGEVPMSRSEKAIQAVRKMLREKGTLVA